MKTRQVHIYPSRVLNATELNFTTQLSFSPGDYNKVMKLWRILGEKLREELEVKLESKLTEDLYE